LAVFEILNHSNTCAVPSACTAVGLLILIKLCPVFTFLQPRVSCWQTDCELFTRTLVLQGSPSTSSRQTQTTHIFADIRIRLLCHALRICVAHALPESCPSFLLVHWAFRDWSSHWFSNKQHYLSAPRLRATKLIRSNVHSGVVALRASMMFLCCSLASSSFTPRKSSFLLDDRLNSRMYSVRWFVLITMPSGLRFQKRCS